MKKTGGSKGGTKSRKSGAKNGTKGDSGRGARELRTRVKTAKGRKISSTRWLDRQLNDPYVQAAKRDGYRGRAAYKLIELDDKLRFLVPGARVVDLGSAPGGWTQVAVKRVNAQGEKQGKAVGTVLGVDIQEVEPIAGSTQLHLDFMDEDAEDKVKVVLDGPADVVLSDMAASASGHRATDHLRIIALAETAAYFAFDVLTEGGTFAAKVLQGGTEGELLALLKKHFRKVSHIKPPSSRSDSAEMFVVAMDFRGGSNGEN